MPAYIVFPNGTVAKYSDGQQVRFESGTGFYARLYDGFTPGARLVATVPIGAAVGFGHPNEVRCEATTPIASLENMAEILSQCADRITTSTGARRLAGLKRKLEGFDARSHCWK
jgi:hypothetical protein